MIPTVTGSQRVWLHAGTLLDGSGAGPLRQAHLVYDASGILYAGENRPPTDMLNPGQRQPDADLPDCTLLPGLIEAHAHLFLEGGELNLERRAAYLKQPSEQLLKLARCRLEKLLRLGVMAVRDAGDKNGVGLALSKLYSGADRPLMPYLDSPGAAIHHQGRYGGFMAEPLEPHASLQACVESRVKAGADRIKLIPTGIINFQKGAVTTEPQMTTEEVRGLVAAANVFGRQTFAHASGDTGIERALDGGVDSIEHGFFIRDDQLARMRDRQIAWVPTFAPIQEQIEHAVEMGWNQPVISHLQRILEQHAASLVKAHLMGVQIIAGSDAGSVGVAHGLGFLGELELMERAGLPPAAVLQSATGTSSSRLGFREKFGQLKPGWRSRFLITRHPPLERISHLRKDKIVVFDGLVLGAEGETDWSGL